MRTLPILVMLTLAGCGARDAVPIDANHPLLWFVGLAAGGFLLAAAWWMVDGVLRRHGRRDERDDRRDARRAEPKQ